jgi:glycine betaine/choline ABC-type transport system substrate-binding protein
MKKAIVLMSLVVMLLSIVGCSQEEKKVVIASKPMTEQYIIVEMLTYLIEENTDITVEQKLGIGGGTSNIHPAMLKGEIDIYPEYTGTGWLFVLGEELINGPSELYQAVKERYKSEYGITW